MQSSGPGTAGSEGGISPVGTVATVLAPERWRPLATEHARRADGFTAGWRERRRTGAKHAIEDFLFTYYPTKPAQLRRWHPGPGVVLTGSEQELAGYAGQRWYTMHDDGVCFDSRTFMADRGVAVSRIRELLVRTLARRANHGCFGLHEWAMVYRSGQVRHEVPLRLGAAATDAVVESHPIRCSHFDAFRFFTPQAVPLNRLRPTRETQPELEQPGCLHAGMDLFKWAMKLSPGLPGGVVLDAFELARDIRTLDMQASPYDVSSYGLEAVAIETPGGKAQYAARQRDFTARAQPLRERLIAACDRLLGASQ